MMSLAVLSFIYFCMAGHGLPYVGCLFDIPVVLRTVPFKDIA
jgi:hypothetical protein